MPRQFMIKKSSPDKDLKMHPIPVEEISFYEEKEIPMNCEDEDFSQTDSARPYDLSVKPKLPESGVDVEKILPHKIPTPPPGVIEFSPKIVTSNMAPPIGIAMIDRDQTSLNRVLKPAASLDALNFRSTSDTGATAQTWQKTLYPPPFMTFPFPPYMSFPRPNTDYAFPSQVPSHATHWKNGLLGGAPITSAPFIPISTTRIPVGPCFSPESHNFFEKSSSHLNHIEEIKEHSNDTSYTNMWPQSDESVSPMSNNESSKESSTSKFSPVVSSSTGSTSVQTPRYFCQACNKSYATYSGLSRHKQFHCITLEKKAFNCKYCEKIYVSLGALKMHIRTHTLPCKCTICGKAFSRPWLLQGHIRTHTGEKPFACSHCNRAFADRSNLRAHLQTHSDIKKYSCNACSKTFSRMSLLLKHNDGGCGAQQRSNPPFASVGSMVLS